MRLTGRFGAAVVAVFIMIAVTPDAVQGNPLAAKAASMLTDRVMKMLEPKIKEMAEKAPLPPAAKEELAKKLTESARKIVKSEVDGAMGGKLPNPVSIFSKVLNELGTISKSMIASAAGSAVGGAVAASSGQPAAGRPSPAAPVPSVALGVAPAATPPPRPLPPPPPPPPPSVAVYVFGNEDPTANKIMALEIQRGLAASKLFTPADRPEAFLDNAVAELNRDTRQERFRDEEPSVRQLQRPLDLSPVLDIAKRGDAKYVFLAGVTSVSGQRRLTGYIVNTQTNAAAAVGETVMGDDIRSSSIEIIRATVRGKIGDL